MSLDKNLFFSLAAKLRKKAESAKLSAGKFRAVRLNSSMTATRSPLNNRVVQSTPGEAEGRTTTLKGSPYTAAGALFQSAFVVFLLPQVLRTLRFLDKPSEQVRVLSEDAFSVISTAQVGKKFFFVYL